LSENCNFLPPSQPYRPHDGAAHPGKKLQRKKHKTKMCVKVPHSGNNGRANGCEGQTSPDVKNLNKMTLVQRTCLLMGGQALQAAHAPTAS